MFIKPILLSIILFALFVLLKPETVKASDWIQQTIDYTINTHFDSAEAVIDERFAEGDSGLPVYFYKASILNSRMTHFEEDTDLKDFYNILNVIIDKANQLIETDKMSDIRERANVYFYRGSAFGYLAYAQGKNGQWLKALDNGLASIKDLEKSVHIDSTLYDACLGIGVYYYWRSTKLKYMLWLPFVPDMREEGIEQIKLAIEKGKYSAGLGMQQLIYILLDYGRFDDAVPYAEKVIKLYPRSQFMRWAHAHVYYKRHEYDKAIDSYLKLLALIKADPDSNPSHWLFCQVRLAEVYFKQEKYSSAIEHAQLALGYQIDRPLKNSEKDKLNQAANILGKSQKLLQKSAMN